MTRLALAALALVLAACSPAPSPVVPFDPRATPERACAALSRLHCPEAQPAPGGASCPDVVRKAMQLRSIDLACISAAPTIVDVRACGSVRCRQ